MLRLPRSSQTRVKRVSLIYHRPVAFCKAFHCLVASDKTTKPVRPFGSTHSASAQQSRACAWWGGPPYDRYIYIYLASDSSQDHILTEGLAVLAPMRRGIAANQPRSTDRRLRVHSKRETHALHLFSLQLAFFYIKLCSKRPGEEKKNTEVLLTSYFRIYTFQRKRKRPKAAWAWACDRTCTLYLPRTTNHVKTSQAGWNWVSYS